jgi:hypothetical protein
MTSLEKKERFRRMIKPLEVQRVRRVLYRPNPDTDSINAYSVTENHQPHSENGIFTLRFHVTKPFRMSHAFFWNPTGVITRLRVGMSDQLMTDVPIDMFAVHWPNWNPLGTPTYEELLRLFFTGLMDSQHMTIETCEPGVFVTIDGAGQFDDVLIGGLEPE